MTEEQIKEVVKQAQDRFWKRSAALLNSDYVIDDIAMNNRIEYEVRQHIFIAETITEVLAAPPPGLPGALRCQRCLKPLGGRPPELHECAS